MTTLPTCPKLFHKKTSMTFDVDHPQRVQYESCVIYWKKSYEVKKLFRRLLVSKGSVVVELVPGSDET